MVAGVVVLAHALFLWVALAYQARHAPAEPVVDQLVVMRIDLPQDDLPAQPLAQEPQPLDPLQLQRLAPRLQDIRIEEPDIEIPVSPPAVQSPQPPLAAAPLTGSADTGLAGNAAQSNGAAGEGDGLVLLRRVLPAYPSTAVRRSEQGISSVIFHIAPDGRVDVARVGRTSGSERLDRAALDAVKKWRFQKLPPSMTPDGKWLRTDLRFVLYQYKYSRLDPQVMDGIFANQGNPRAGPMEEATPGSQDALARFIAAVRDGTFAAADAASRTQIEHMRAALQKWGAVRSMQFMGAMNGTKWLSYPLMREYPGRTAGTVELVWNMFEVRLANGTSEWLIATDHDGRVWAAWAGPAPWT